MKGRSMIRRELYMRQIRPLMGTNIIKVLSGVRRSGKSVLLELIQDELIEKGTSRGSIVSLNFESPQNERLLDARTLYEYVVSKMTKSGVTHVFLDEVQEVPEWERAIDGLQADYHDRIDLYLTGSNAHFLSGEIATLLSGRYVEIQVYPLGFSEYQELYRETVPDVDERTAFSSFLETGGVPALREVSFDEDAATRYLSSIYDTIVLKDVVQRHQVRDANLLDILLRYVIANCGHVFSANSISKVLAGRNVAVASSTIATYLDYAVEANFLLRAEREDAITKKVFVSQEKYYLVDHGFRQALYGHNVDNIDMVLENIVFMELTRHGWSVRVGTIDGKEVDFIAERRGEKVYVQVCYLLASEDTRRREFGAFEGIRDNYPKYVLSLDEVPMGKDGILHMNLRDFLLRCPLA